MRSLPQESRKSNRGSATEFAHGFMKGFAQSLALHHDLYGFRRFEIRKCAFSEDKNEAVVYVQIWDDDEYRAKWRFWVRRHGADWRLFDFEDLSGGHRFSTAAAGVGATAKTRGGETFSQVNRVLPESTRAILAGEFERAEQLINGIDVRSLPPSFQATIEVQLAVICIGREQYQPAIEACDQAERLNPNIPLVWGLRAKRTMALANLSRAGQTRKSISIRWARTPMDICTSDRH